MQPHRQLDQHHPHVLGHGQQHFPQAFQLPPGMLGALVQLADRVEFGDARGQSRNPGTELILHSGWFQVTGSDQFMQQGGGHDLVIHAQIGQ